MDSIKLKTVFGSETVIFNLKVLTVAEENKIRASTFGLKDDEKEAKEYDNIVSVLSEHSAEAAHIPTLETVEVEGGKTETKEVLKPISVREYFQNRTAAKERIAHTAFRAWMVALQPSYDFL